MYIGGMPDIDNDLRLPRKAKQHILSALAQKANFLHEAGDKANCLEDFENDITYIESVMALIRNWPEKGPPHGNR